MLKTGETSDLCQNDETLSCSNLYRSVEIRKSLQSQTMTKKLTITYFESPAITKITATNLVPEMLQQPQRSKIWYACQESW